MRIFWGTYLVKLSEKQVSASDSAEAAKLLKMIGDFERISDHAVNLLGSADEMREKGMVFTEPRHPSWRSLLLR